MNVCPTCHSRFVGGETFCPHDGSRLVDARELSPGELTGSKLDDVVRLDRLVHSDGLGERYAGRLLDSRRAVFVTVLNQAFSADADATTRMETARAKVGSPLPPEINTILQLHLDKNPAYVIESEPRGPSVRQLIDERRQLDWKEAVKITAHLARIAQWLHEQGIPFHNVHPAGVYVTRLATGEVQVGDWALDALIGSDSPTRMLEEAPGAFVGYADYLAPELSADSSKSDLRSAVYALGCLLYEMVLGKPPLSAQTTAETLKRHRHEKPVRLAIARGGGEFPDSLDDLIEMMLAKEPDKRFQSANAVVAALSNLVDLSPDELAPPLDRAPEAEEDDLYRTINMDSVARDELLPPAQQAAAPSADEPQTVSAGGTLLGTSSTRDEESESGARKTLLFGNIGTAIKAPAATKPTAQDSTPNGAEPSQRSTLVLGDGRNTLVLGDDGKETPPDQEERANTLLMGSGSGAEASEAVETPESKSADHGFSRDAAPSAVLKRKTIGKIEREPAAEEAVESSPDAVQLIKRSDISGEIDAVAPPAAIDAAEEVEEVDEVEEVEQAAEASPDRPKEAEVPKPSKKGKGKRKGKRRKSGPAASLESPSESDAEDSEELSEPSVAEKEEVAPAEVPAAQPALTEEEVFAKGRDHTRELDRSEWFSVPSEDAWDASLADEHHARTERRFRLIIGGVLAALAVIVLGLFIYFEYVYTPEEEEGALTEEAESTKETAKAEAPVFDAAPTKAAFDEALAGDRLVAPLSNSALHHLEVLKRRAPDSTEFAAARDAFVDRARKDAVAADEAGNLNEARILAGYASQYAPEDAELARMTADLQARYTGQTAPDAGAPEAEQAAEVAAPVEPPVEVEKPVQKKPAQKKKPSQKKAQKKGESSAELVRDARVALSRGNTNEARLLYHQALELDGKNADIHAGLGKVYFEQSNYREAVKYQQKAIRYAPGRLDYRIALGQSFYRLGKYQEAIDVWESVLKKEPDNRFARQYIELARKKL